MPRDYQIPPILSISDLSRFLPAKKKELLGNFHRAGQTFTQQTVETYDHDFGTPAKES